jgi:hypothetical protein
MHICISSLQRVVRVNLAAGIEGTAYETSHDTRDADYKLSFSAIGNSLLKDNGETRFRLLCVQCCAIFPHLTRLRRVNVKRRVFLVLIDEPCCLTRLDVCFLNF